MTKPESLDGFLLKAASSPDYISDSFAEIDRFLNSGADRGCIVDALAAYIDSLGGQPSFNPEPIAHLTWRNRM